MKHLFNLKNRSLLLTLVSIGILFCLLLIPKSSTASEQSSQVCEQSTTPPDIVEKKALSPSEQILKLIKNQEEVDSNLRKELASNEYTLATPFVIVDPYGVSPLTALVIFSTDEPSRVSLHIEGKTSLADVDYTFDHYSQTHAVPVYGLYPDAANKLVLTSVNQSGKTEESILEIKTSPLPQFLQMLTNITYTSDVRRYSPGFNFTYDIASGADKKRALDINGDTRWFLNLATLFTGCYNSDGSITIATGAYFTGEVMIYNMSKLGRISEIYASDFGVHHDIELTNNNTMLITGSTGETNQDIVYEIDKNTGEVVNILDYKNILQRSRVAGIFRDNVDWMHMNAVVHDGNDVIVSSNYQSTVIKNSREGDIKWMLCDPQGYYTSFQPYILKPIGNDFEYPYNQHAVEMLPDYDNNPNTVDILLFDNGSSRNAVDKELQRAVSAKEIIEPALYSRLVHYRIDEKNMTVEQLWQYGKERPELFSAHRGDADLLPNGNILGCFNVEAYPKDEGVNDCRSVVYTEVDKDKNVIWECFTTSKRADNFMIDYRIERLPIYSDKTDYVELDIPIKNMIPKEILSRYEN